MDLARVERVPVKEAWPIEDRHFTPWLAQNLSALGELIGMDLELVAMEVPVGPYRVDIVASRPGSDEMVVIENQFGKTNHDHLGKLLTYAAGQDAMYAVWIAESFSPEHRSALEWANRHSQDGVGFFGLRLEAVKIGSSPIAPQLVVVVEPDDWARQVQQSSARSEVSDKSLAYAEFWGQLIDQVKSTYPGWTNSTKPPRQNWWSPPAGKGWMSYGVVFAGDGRLRVELYVDGPDAETQQRRWAVLEADRMAIDTALPGLEWEPLEHAKASRVGVYSEEPADVLDVSNHDRLRTWTVQELGRLRSTLQPYVDRMP